MNKEQRVESLKQVITHTIRGEQDLAEALFKQVVSASARTILVGESNYALDSDPEFDARREMQRELEDDIDAGKMEPGADDMGACPECGAEPCECEGGTADDEIGQIVDKLESGNVDDEILSQILAMVADVPAEGEGESEGEPSLTDEVPAELPGEAGEVGADGEIDLTSPLKTEGAEPLNQELLEKLKRGLTWEFDQFMDAGGDPADWMQIALDVDSSPEEMQELFNQIPAGQQNVYMAILRRFVMGQVPEHADAKLGDLI